MMTEGVSRYALCVNVAAAMLAGCGAAKPRDPLSIFRNT